MEVSTILSAHPLERKMNRITTRIDFRRTHRTRLSALFHRRRRRGCVEAGAVRRAAVTARRESRRTGPARSPRDVAREASVSRSPRRGARAVRSRRARSLLVHLLVLLPLDEVDDAGDGGGDLRIARRGTTRCEARNARGNSRRTKRPRCDGRYSRTRLGSGKSRQGLVAGRTAMPPRPHSDSRLLGLLYHFLSSSASAMAGGLRGGGVLGRGGGVSVVVDGSSRARLLRRVGRVVHE